MPGWALRTHGDLNQEHRQFCNYRKILFGVHRLRRPLAHLNLLAMLSHLEPAVFDDLPAILRADSPKFIAEPN